MKFRTLLVAPLRSTEDGVSNLESTLPEYVCILNTTSGCLDITLTYCTPETSDIYEKCIEDNRQNIPGAFHKHFMYFIGKCGLFALYIMKSSMF